MLKKGNGSKDAAFLKWLSYQPSCIDGSYSEFVDGVGRCVAAHVRGASNSGTGIKPKFSAVPLTQEQHLRQHQYGEKSMLEYYLGREFTVESAHEWFKEKANYYLEKWRKG